MSSLIHVGIDVSKDWLDVAVSDGRARRFDNGAAGHRSLLTWLSRRHGCRVVLESTGTYGLDLALTLHAADRCEVMVVNPRLVKGFAQALSQRLKTDAADAKTLLAFVERMPFEPWSPPSPAVVELRAMSRRIEDLTVERTREKNRLSSLRSSVNHSHLIARDIEVNLRHLDRRINQMLDQAVAHVKEHRVLTTAYGHVTSIKGIAAKSAIALLGELLVLPPNMTPKQWVAHAGLDPREYESGSSVRRRARISKVGNAHIRRALYMPALVAAAREPRVKSFYDDLRAKGKNGQVANVAVMQKLLRSIHGMLRYGTDFDGERFRATSQKDTIGT